LITAYKKLDAKLREKNKLVLVGSPLDKACYNSTLALINRLQLNRDVIIFTGLSKDKLRCLYQNTELFIFASLIENSPNILLEAMKSGSPILTTNLQPMPEFCGNSADYFSGLDAQELTSKISLLLNNLEKRNAMKIKSRLRAKNFTWDNFTKKIIKEVRSIN
jgi:Glycosyltransferase